MSSAESLKRCKKCEDAGRPFMHPVSSFSRNRSTKDGLSFYCKSCESLLGKAQRHTHAEKVKQSRRNAYYRDVNASREYRNAYYHQHRETYYLSTMRKNYDKHREQRIETTRVWNESHPESQREAALRTYLRKQILTKLIVWVLREPRRVFVFHYLYDVLKSMIYEHDAPQLLAK